MGLESVLMLVAGVGGSVSGAAAGSAVAKLFEPNPIGPDTSIPGVKKAVLQEAGKNNPEMSIAQVDPTEAISYFKKAAESYQSQALTGLGLYTASAAEAVKAVNTSVTDANKKLDSYVTNGNTASDRYLNMLGLPSADGSKALTGAQASDMLANTPGYQFTLAQGNQALARAGLATGMGASGNTMAAAQQYGQGLAQTTYQQYLQNLSPMIELGATASGQQASNLMSQGTQLSTIYGNLGSAALNTYDKIGTAFSNMNTNTADMIYNAASSNVNSQNAALAAQKQQAADLQKQMVASGPGYMQASTGQQEFDYKVFQNQQAGQAYYSSGTNKVI